MSLFGKVEPAKKNAELLKSAIDEQREQQKAETAQSLIDELLGLIRENFGREINVVCELLYLPHHSSPGAFCPLETPSGKFFMGKAGDGSCLAVYFPCPTCKELVQSNVYVDGADLIGLLEGNGRLHIEPVRYDHRNGLCGTPPESPGQTHYGYLLEKMGNLSTRVAQLEKATSTSPVVPCSG